MWLTVALAGAVLALDVLSKAQVMARMVEGQSIPVIAGLLHLTYIRNPGAAYGLLHGQRWLLVAIAAAVCLGIFYYALRVQARWERAALGLLLGGAVGNLVDRIRWGLVTDFIEIRPLHAVFQVFNVADMAVTGAVALLVLLALVNPAGRQRSDHSEPA